MLRKTLIVQMSIWILIDFIKKISKVVESIQTPIYMPHVDPKM